MSKKTFSFLVLLVIVVLALAASAKTATAHWSVNRLGQLIYQTDQQVLGDEDGPQTNKAEETAKHQAEQQREAAKKQEEQSGVQVETQTENGKTQVEIQTAAGEKINRQTEKGKLHLKVERGKLKLEEETEEGETTEVGEDDEVEIEPNDDEDKVKIATGSGEDEMVITRNRVRARTNFPLSVDLNTNELIVTTPNGVKRVTVLPDQAIAKLLQNNVIDRVESPETETEAELTEAAGMPAYEVSGESDQKLLGVVPVKIKSKVKVSAETGEVISTEKTLRDRLFDLLSF